MSRHTAVLEKQLGSDESVERTFVSKLAPSTCRTSRFTSLIARLFGGPEPLRVVAFASTLPGEGVTYATRHVVDELERTTELRPTVVTAAELLGSVSSSPTQILGAPPLSTRSEQRDRLSVLRSEYDIVLIDAGSVGDSGEIVGVARKADAIVIVVEAGRSTKADLSQTLETVIAAGGRIAGLILNKRRNWAPAWIERLIG